MDWLAKLAVGLVTGLLVYFLYPNDKSARPITAAAFGLVGAAVGGLLSIKIQALGGPFLTPASLATSAGGAALFTLAYLNISS
jgi:uncharacterized membrane protein YeaQ/YmgE (transglycosylase-associated protein family)